MVASLISQALYIPVERKKGDLIEPQGPGQINWTQNIIRAKGWGIIDTTLPKPQAKLMAIRAAQVVAQRNLLEIIKGVRVVSETRVQDLMMKSDYIYTRIEGIVKGAQMVGEPVEKDGMIEVELAISIYDSNGIAPVIQKEIGKKLESFPSLTDKEKEEIKKISGVIVDARGTGAKPAIFPRIVDEKGNVLFDPSEYYNPNDPNFQKIFKIVTLTEEELKETEIGKNAYFIKASKAIHSDIVVNKENAKKINWLKKTFHTLIKIGKILWIIL
jgi:hypothetical protein